VFASLENSNAQSGEESARKNEKAMRMDKPKTKFVQNELKKTKYRNWKKYGGKS